MTMKHTLRFATVVTLFCTVFSLAPMSSQAATILGEAVRLDTLLADGGSITAGDKLFDDFSYTLTGTMPEADQVNVIPIQDDLGNFGIRFQGAFVDLPGGSGSDSVIEFSVTSMNAARPIIGANLAANVALVGSGTAQVIETFIPDSDSQMLVVFNSPGGASLMDSTQFDAPMQTLRVQKDILLFSDDQGNPPGVFASMSFVDQTFTQIPEPTSVLLGGLALAGGVLMARRRQG